MERLRWEMRVMDEEARKLAEEACARYNESLRTVTCAFCGLTYPPRTPASGALILAEHVAECLAHPMRKVERELSEAQAKLKLANNLAERLHMMEPFRHGCAKGPCIPGCNSSNCSACLNYEALAAWDSLAALREARAK